MNQLDEQMLRGAIRQLDVAQEHIKKGGIASDLLAAMHIGFAKSDIEIVLKIQPTKEVA